MIRSFVNRRALGLFFILGMPHVGVHAQTQVVDPSVTRLVTMADAQDQGFVGHALMASAATCMTRPDPNGCTVDQLIEHGSKHGFGLAIEESFNRAHQPVPDVSYDQAAWTRALQSPANRTLLFTSMTAADQATIDKACPTQAIGCWGPKVLDFGMSIGIRLYQSSDRAGLFNDLKNRPSSPIVP